MINHNTAMFYAFIKLLARIAGRGIPLVIFILETGGRGFASRPGLAFLAAAVYSISPGAALRAAAASRRAAGAHCVVHRKEKRLSASLAISASPSLTPRKQTFKSHFTTATFVFVDEIFVSSLATRNSRPDSHR